MTSSNEPSGSTFDYDQLISGMVIGQPILAEWFNRQVQLMEDKGTLLANIMPDLLAPEVIQDMRDGKTFILPNEKYFGFLLERIASEQGLDGDSIDNFLCEFSKVLQESVVDSFSKIQDHQANFTYAEYNATLRFGDYKFSYLTHLQSGAAGKKIYNSRTVAWRYIQHK